MGGANIGHDNRARDHSLVELVLGQQKGSADIDVMPCFPSRSCEEVHPVESGNPDTGSIEVESRKA